MGKKTIGGIKKINTHIYICVVSAVLLAIVVASSIIIFSNHKGIDDAIDKTSQPIEHTDGVEEHITEEYNTDDKPINNETNESPSQATKPTYGTPSRPNDDTSYQESVPQTSPEPEPEISQEETPDAEPPEETIDCNSIANELYAEVVNKIESYYAGLEEDADSYGRKKAATAGGGEGFVNAYKEEYRRMHQGDVNTYTSNLVQSAYSVANSYGCGTAFLSLAN